VEQAETHACDAVAAGENSTGDEDAAGLCKDRVLGADRRHMVKHGAADHSGERPIAERHRRSITGLHPHAGTVTIAETLGGLRLDLEAREVIDTEAHEGFGDQAGAGTDFEDRTIEVETVEHPGQDLPDHFVAPPVGDAVDLVNFVHRDDSRGKTRSGVAPSSSTPSILRSENAEIYSIDGDVVDEMA